MGKWIGEIPFFVRRYRLPDSGREVFALALRGHSETMSKVRVIQKLAQWLEYDLAHLQADLAEEERPF